MNENINPLNIGNLETDNTLPNVKINDLNINKSTNVSTLKIKPDNINFTEDKVKNISIIGTLKHVP